MFYHSNSHQLDGFCSNSFISCNLQIFFPLFVLFFSAECRINTEKLFHLCCKRIYAKTVVSDKHKQKLWMQMKANQVGKKRNFTEQQPSYESVWSSVLEKWWNRMRIKERETESESGHRSHTNASQCRKSTDIANRMPTDTRNNMTAIHSNGANGADSRLSES